MVVHVSGHLNPGGQQFRGDHGAADPQVAAALAAYLAGQGSEQAALHALSAARLLVPVIAVLGDGTAPATGDKNSEMVLPKLIGHDGRPAVLAFTCTGALARWRPGARPVPAEAGRVWRAAVADGCAVVIDVAGPVPLAVEGARLAALAAGQPVPAPHQDRDVRAAVEAAIVGEPAIAGFSLAPGRPDRTDRSGRRTSRPENTGRPESTGPADGTSPPDSTGPPDGTDLAVTLRLAAPRADDWAQAVNRAAASIAARLGDRLRRGIEVGITH
jgi:SseB protein N-terminal domain